MFSRDKSDLSLSSKEVEGEFTEELEDMAGESMVVMVRGEAGAGLGMLTLTRPILFITSLLESDHFHTLGILNPKQAHALPPFTITCNGSVFSVLHQQTSLTIPEECIE